MSARDGVFSRRYAWLQDGCDGKAQRIGEVRGEDDDIGRMKDEVRRMKFEG